MQREEQEQRELIRWANLFEHRYPDLALLFHVPNGGLRPTGETRSGEAGKMIGLGAKSGVPDLCLPVPRGEYHGLWIEMKAGKNKPSDNQRWWIAELRRQGHRVEVCYAWHEAKDVIVNYLES